MNQHDCISRFCNDLKGNGGVKIFLHPLILHIRKDIIKFGLNTSLKKRFLALIDVCFCFLFIFLRICK